ncbi:MAG: 30S ribosomal protein S8 [Spirochaetes bacterium]|nr:MAG: 30S ribosomal protein S8 [Spirochaetota bacterium]
MAVTDPLADMLTKIRNASSAKFEKVDVKTSKLKLEVVKILKNEGYIKNFKKTTKENVNYIRIFLKYDSQDRSVIHGLKKISTPGRRMYTGYKKLPRIYNGHGILVVSTSDGVITGKKASEKKIGGELICSVW